ncbi:ATP-binding protein [Geminisphaera colitermitum]|uniref:ATP-binding protein n=1 Tax=Geminisphaera colitermitum TaxID=1148786 RepID=UPI0018E2F9D6|nr:ATP-binding protein [Geminisphaera colitermitum]
MTDTPTLPTVTADDLDKEQSDTVTRGPLGRASVKFYIPGDKIHMVTADLPVHQREAIRWAAGFCRSKNLSHVEFAALLKKPDGESYHKDSVYHMFTGGRTETALAPMVEAIQRLRKIEDQRAAIVQSAFVETRLAKRIFDLCRRALIHQKILFVFGDSQIGKTWSLEEYARRHNHGETKYVRVPAGGAITAFVRELAAVLGLGYRMSPDDLKRAIINCFDSRMLLVVDECEECLSECGSALRSTGILNFVREIHDRKKCGVVLAGANIFRERLYHGKHTGSMQRLVRRGMIPLQLPAVSSNADLAAIAAHYGLPPIPDQELGIRVTVVDDDGNDRRLALTKNPFALQTEVNRDDGLGRWCMILKEAADLAREKGKALSWGFVLHAWHNFKEMESLTPDPMQTIGEEAA